MATDRIFVDYVAEQLGLGARLGHKKMFGEYALYIDGKVVAFACDNSLFIKPNEAVAKLHPDLPRRPPYPEAKDHPVADELLDDSEALRRVFIDSAAVLPAPKSRLKPVKTTRASANAKKTPT